VVRRRPRPAFCFLLPVSEAAREPPATQGTEAKRI
jgi:hypothetical protein